MEKFKCCLCDKEVQGFGNNPDPLGIGGEDEDAFETHVMALHAPSDEHDSSETNEALLETELSVTDDAEASENQTPTDSRDADETYSYFPFLNFCSEKEIRRKFGLVASYLDRRFYRSEKIFRRF